MSTQPSARSIAPQKLQTPGQCPREPDFDLREFLEGYQKDPTIETYVGMRRKHPRLHPNVATTGGIEWLYACEEELQQLGFDPQLVASTLDADLEAQSECSLRVLEKIVERRRKTAAGGTHLASRGEAISDKFIAYFIGVMLDALDWNGQMEISSDLIVLIKEQLGVGSSSYEVSVRKAEQRREATFIAAQIVSAGETPSYRRIGKLMGVEASTVKRWFPDGEMMRLARKLSNEVKNLRVLRQD